jgi:hypothetical protein
MIPLRAYLLIGAIVSALSVVSYVYVKGRGDGADSVITQTLKDDQRAIEKATKARRAADMRNAGTDGLHQNDGFRRD